MILWKKRPCWHWLHVCCCYGTMHCLAIAIVYCPSLSNFPPLTYKDWLACQQTRSSCSTPPLAPVTDQKKPAVWAATPREAGWILGFSNRIPLIWILIIHIGVVWVRIPKLINQALPPQTAVHHQSRHSPWRQTSFSDPKRAERIQRWLVWVRHGKTKRPLGFSPARSCFLRIIPKDGRKMDLRPFVPGSSQRSYPAPQGLAPWSSRCSTSIDHSPDFYRNGLKWLINVLSNLLNIPGKPFQSISCSVCTWSFLTMMNDLYGYFKGSIHFICFMVCRSNFNPESMHGLSHVPTGCIKLDVLCYSHSSRQLSKSRASRRSGWLGKTLNKTTTFGAARGAVIHWGQKQLQYTSVPLVALPWTSEWSHRDGLASKHNWRVQSPRHNLPKRCKAFRLGFLLLKCSHQPMRFYVFADEQASNCCLNLSMWRSNRACMILSLATKWLKTMHSLNQC